MEAFNHLGLIMVREYCRDYRDAFVYGEGMVDQLFPGWDVTSHERAVKSRDVHSSE